MDWKELNLENETIARQLEHRTIRQFKDEALPEELLKKLLAVAQRTASSTGLQACSIIRVTDREKRAAIAEVCKQAYVKDCPEFWVLIVDQYRNYKICEEKAVDPSGAASMDSFFQGFSDAILCAQNVSNSVESLGLGAVFFGSILNDPLQIIRILDLPLYTFPALGLGMGIPNQSPQLKPRMPMELRVYENGYRRYEGYLDELRDYDVEMRTYYDLREANRRVDSFTDQVVTRSITNHPGRRQILRAVREQGFDLLV